MSDTDSSFRTWLTRRTLTARDQSVGGLRRFALFLLKDVAVLIAGLLVVLSALVFIAIADEVQEGKTQRFDDWALKALRRPDDLATPIGPAWLRDSAVDLTALGGSAVVVLVLVAVVGFLLLERFYAYTWLVVGASGGGILINLALKRHFNRARPTVVPHLRDVVSLSFPSGHAMLSAIVYLTLGALLVPLLKERRSRIYCLGAALLLTAIIGMSRVYLGVHYPTDVLAGWAIGFAWALLCWLALRQISRRAKAAAKPDEAPVPPDGSRSE